MASALNRCVCVCVWMCVCVCGWVCVRVSRARPCVSERARARLLRRFFSKASKTKRAGTDRALGLSFTTPAGRTKSFTGRKKKNTDWKIKGNLRAGPTYTAWGPSTRQTDRGRRGGGADTNCTTHFRDNEKKTKSGCSVTSKDFSIARGVPGRG